MKYFYFLLILFFVGNGFQAIAGGTNDSSIQYFDPEEIEVELEEELIVQILTLAAPHYGYSPDQFIRLYYHCSCITITELGPNLYRVVYGGIGIEILIDVSFVVGDFGTDALQKIHMKF